MLGDLPGLIELTPDQLMYDVMNNTHSISDFENKAANRAIELAEEKKFDCPNVTNLFDEGRVVIGADVDI